MGKVCSMMLPFLLCLLVRSLLLYTSFVSATVSSTGAGAIPYGRLATEASRKKDLNDLSSEIIVKKDGTGNFASVQDAVNAVPEGNTKRVIIRIYSGTYNEKVEIPSTKPFVTFKGEGPTYPIITGNETATTAGSTWNSSTVAVNADHFVARHVVFRNTAPAPAPGAEGGQGVAVRLLGDKAAFFKCEFLGAQDTLADMVGRHYFKNCLIQGTVDFIFGNGQSIYNGCKLVSIATTFGSVAAHKRESTSEKTGFSFVNCVISGTGRAVYLGRAWGPAARIVFSRTFMPDFIRPEGWHDWDNATYHPTIYFGEYRNTGSGAERTGRVDYSINLSKKEVDPFLRLSFIDADEWLEPQPR